MILRLPNEIILIIHKFSDIDTRKKIEDCMNYGCISYINLVSNYTKDILNKILKKKVKDVLLGYVVLSIKDTEKYYEIYHDNFQKRKFYVKFYGRFSKYPTYDSM